MDNDYEILNYNLHTKESIKIGDIVKISIYFKEAYNLQKAEIAEYIKENIWTIVEEVKDNIIFARINNYMFYKPLNNNKTLEFNKILVFNKSKIKEIKRYDTKSKNEKMNLMITILQNLSQEQKTILSCLNDEDFYQYIEQVINQ